MYIVNLEGQTVEAGTVAKVKELLGDNKVTKKAIEAGDYPMVSLASAVESEVAVTDDSEGKEEVTLTDIAKESDNVEIIMVTDSPKVEAELNTKLPEDATDEPTEPVVESKDEDTEPPVEDTTDEGSHLSTETLGKINEGMEEDNQPPTQPIAMVDKAKLNSQGFVQGATVSIHDDSVNEELLTAFLDADVDQAIILTLREEGILLDVAGLTETPIPHTDLVVVAPPKPKADNKPKKNTKLVVDPDKDGYPEQGHFTAEADIKKYIKALTNEQLKDWCELEGATWNPHDNESINRMRMAMSIKAVHFPHLASGTGTGKKKSKSKYADYTNEQLAQMALDNDVEVPDAKGDTRIERMYTIMALRKANVLE